MTRERQLDERMFEWLEAGPDEAPLRTLEAAVAYARAHPRTRLTWIGLGRTLMTRLHLAEVAPRPQHRLPMAMVSAAAVVVIAVVAGGALLVGSGPRYQSAGGVPPATPTPTTASSPSPTAVPAVSPLPTPPVAVMGSQVCDVAKAGTDSNAGDVTQTRGLVLGCTGPMSDPRLEGAAQVAVSIDTKPDGSAEIWGTATITNAGGTWTGPWSGTVDTGYTTHHMVGLYVGSGTYDGLQVRYSQETAGDVYDFRGTLEQTDSIPPDGTTVVLGNTCSTTSIGTTTAGDGVTHYTGIVLDCLGDASDPRLDGQMRVTVDIDERADESADMRGTFTIIGREGAWTGSWTGSIAAGYTTHWLEGAVKGSGAYQGLEFRYSQIGLDDVGYVMTGVIGPTD